MRKNIVSILNLPYTKWVGAGLYSAVFKISKIVLETNNSKVWARNSLKLGTAVYGKSDIDLTYFTTELATQKDISRVETKRKWLKRLFLLICEVNYYSLKREEALRLINRYEAKRDPELLKQIVPYSDGKSDDDIEYLVFLLRQLEADWENLNSCPETRVTKWAHHLVIVEDEITPTELISTIVGKIHIIVHDQGLLIDRELLDQVIFETLNPQKSILSLNPLNLFFFPHLWHRFYTWNQFDLFLEHAKVIESKFLNRILTSQVKWEIWGELVQIGQSKDRSFLYNAHLPVLRKINEVFIANKIGEINTSLDWITEYYQQYFKNITTNHEHSKIKSSLNTKAHIEIDS